MVDVIQRRRALQIPDELVTAVVERRVIPFIGAGFSSTLGLPDWRQMLRNLCEELDVDLSFDEISRFADGDFLQIAEYLYLKSDRRIGPLRHVIERGLIGVGLRPAVSTAHVELVNLGAPQIYTTNYDDVLERTYQALERPYSVVALPKDVARATSQDAQIIKYHGDLRHEGTLVLTESAYYKRLDFESPMDLKFRSDLLGRSVLYMGYSFKDINIRLIWFKLMQMMQDIPEADRRPSYIVRLGANPVLDELYRDVGLRTIILDPEMTYDESDRRKLLGEFLGELASKADQSSGEESRTVQFVSAGLIEQVAEWADRSLDGRGEVFDLGRLGPRPAATIRRFLSREVPDDLDQVYQEAFFATLPHVNAIPTLGPNLFPKIRRFGPSKEIVEFFVSALRGGSANLHEFRQSMDSLDPPWLTIWGARIGDDALSELIHGTSRELEWTKAGFADEDLVYCAELLQRVVLGQIYEASNDRGKELVEHARSLVAKAAEIYPSLSSLAPDSSRGPEVSGALVEVSERQNAIEAGKIVRDPNYEPYPNFGRWRALHEGRFDGIGNS